jgi:hypothetical protein
MIKAHRHMALLRSERDAANCVEMAYRYIHSILIHYMLIYLYTHILIHSYTHILIHYILIHSYTHILIYSYTHTLILIH